MKPELVFGIVGAIGADVEALCACLKDSLSEVEYGSHEVKLSSELRGLDAYRTLPESPLDQYYIKHIEAGDELCQRTGSPHAMVALGFAGIKRVREQLEQGENSHGHGVAYIIRSLKRPSEVDLLRRTYGDRFFTVAAYAPRATRVSKLATRIAASHGERSVERFRGKAEDLVTRDQDEVGVSHGQNVSATFPLADVFINTANDADMKSQAKRFVHLLFGDPFITPTVDEYGMFLARGAARRSADLARQVGASILDGRGRVMALGTNEAPRFSGGVYWAGDHDDKRDFVIGTDPSNTYREQIVEDVLRRLRLDGWLSDARKRQPVGELVQDALSAGGATMRDSLAMDVIEFGRSIHAEMCAITDAAFLGIPTNGMTMYSTTFPCHNCARHIVSAGLNRLVYVEPYPKSLAGALFGDAVIVDPESTPTDRVAFVPFVGIGPAMYDKLFEPGRRKDERGRVIPWDAGRASPRVTVGGVSDRDKELATLSELQSDLSAAGIIPPEANNE